MKKTLLPFILVSLAAGQINANENKDPKLWRPLLIESYYNVEGNWILTATSSNKFDMMTGAQTENIIFNYDLDGNLNREYISKYKDGFQVFSKTISGDRISYEETEWDTRARTVVLGKSYNNYFTGEIEEEPSLYRMYQNIITRNDDGNITSIVMRDKYQFSTEDDWIPGGTVEVEYGSEGKATAIRQYSMAFGELQLDSYLTDIVWENTDGQTPSTSFGYYIGIDNPNSIKSAKTLYQYRFPALVQVTYNGENGYEYTIDAIDYDIRLQEYKYTRTETAEKIRVETVTDQIVLEVIDDTPHIVSQMKTISVSENDLFGCPLLYSSQRYENNELRSEYKREYQVVYDSESGFPLEYSSEDSKTVYVESTYIDSAAGIEDAVLESENIEYYNLQGLKVENPHNGVFIRRQGSKTSKVYIK